MNSYLHTTRRELLRSGVAAGLVLCGGKSAKAAIPDSDLTVPIPDQVPVTEGLADLGQTRLWYWDTGGEGEAVVLMHPASSSSEIWPYQQPVFAAAGYRVIAYSRRGYYRSDPVPDTDPGHASTDLGNMLEFLSVEKCHLVGSAAGCQISLDFALSYPSRLHSLIFSSGTGGIQDEDYVRAMEDLRLAGLDELPVEERELSPAYRAANRQGTARWKELTGRAVTSNRRGQTNVNRIEWAALEQLNVPVLVMGGEEDLFMPPAFFGMIASHLPQSELAIIPNAGHSIFWERPEVFNSLVLDFISRNKG